jgi:hypothetical protein
VSVRGSRSAGLPHVFRLYKKGGDFVRILKSIARIAFLPCFPMLCLIEMSVTIRLYMENANLVEPHLCRK